MIPIDDSTFNNLEWKPVDGMKVDALLQDTQVIGAEPTDYPLTNSMIIYVMNNQAGTVMAVEIGTDQTIDSTAPLYINIATIET